MGLPAGHGEYVCPTPHYMDEYQKKGLMKKHFDVVDSKRCDVRCLSWQGRLRVQKEKREQAPAVQM